MQLKYFSLVFIVLISSCAQQSTLEMTSPSLTEVRATPDQYRGQSIHWGGEIAAVTNNADETRFEIVQHSLNRHGKPIGDETQGRFFAYISGFVDPTIYKSGRLISVKGNYIRMLESQVGNYKTEFPEIRVSSHKLWPIEPKVIYNDDPWRNTYGGWNAVYPGWGFPHHHFGVGIGISR